MNNIDQATKGKSCNHATDANGMQDRMRQEFKQSGVVGNHDQMGPTQQQTSEEEFREEFIKSFSGL